MEFNEEKARIFINKFDLNEKTLRVWKSRGQIPDKYANDFLSKKISSEADIQTQKNIVHTLRMGKMNLASLSRLTFIDRWKLVGAISGRYIFTKDEVIILKKAINQIRIEVKELITLLEKHNVSNEKIEEKTKLIFKRKELYFSKFFIDISIYKKFEGWILKRRVYPDEVKDSLQNALSIFLIETIIN